MRPVRIALDGRRLQDDVPGGVARYIAGILPGLVAEPDLDVVVVGDGRRRRPELDVPFEGVTWLPGAPELAWLDGAVRPWLKRTGRLFHGTFNQVPLFWSRPCVVTVHDLSFELHRRDFGAFKAFAWRRYGRHSVRVASAILADSEFIRRQIVDHFRIPEERVTVAPLAISQDFVDLAERSRTPVSAPYVTALGGAPRRNLSVAIEAWRAARAVKSDLKLVVVGTEEPHPEPGLVYLGPADDATWAATLAGAEALVYPTEYEGYGVPAHEALALGTPVVCARVSALPEILGDAGAWADGHDGPAIARSLMALLADPSRHATTRERSRERARHLPTWADSAGAIADVYRRVVSTNGGSARAG